MDLKDVTTFAYKQHLGSNNCILGIYSGTSRNGPDNLSIIDDLRCTCPRLVAVSFRQVWLWVPVTQDEYDFCLLLHLREPRNSIQAAC